MVPAMHQVESAPLARGERAEDGVTGHGLSEPKAGLTLGNQLVHMRDVVEDFARYPFDGSALRENAFRRLVTFWKISEPDDDAALPAFPLTICAQTRLARGERAFQVPDGTGISQVQMIEYLRGTPLAFPMTGEVIPRHFLDRADKGGPQSNERRMHV